MQQILRYCFCFKNAIHHTVLKIFFLDGIIYRIVLLEFKGCWVKKLLNLLHVGWLSHWLIGCTWYVIKALPVFATCPGLDLATAAMHNYRTLEFSINLCSITNSSRGEKTNVYSCLQHVQYLLSSDVSMLTSYRFVSASHDIVCNLSWRHSAAQEAFHNFLLYCRSYEENNGGYPEYPSSALIWF